MGKMWAGAISGALAARAFLPKALKNLKERGNIGGKKKATTTTMTSAAVTTSPISVRRLCDSTTQMLKPKQYLDRLAKVCPQELDLTEPSHGSGAMEAADALIRLEPGLARAHNTNTCTCIPFTHTHGLDGLALLTSGVRLSSL